MRFVLALVLASAPAVAEPGQYLCIAELSGGLDFNRTTHAWEGRGFRTDAKYILRPLREKELDQPIAAKGKWTLGFFKFGDNGLPLAYCKESDDPSLSWQCTRFIIEVQIDKRSLRFQALYRGGYIDQGNAEQLRRSDPERYRRDYEIYLSQGADLIGNPDSAAIEIGKCSPL
jgi:hypothetical protein